MLTNAIAKHISSDFPFFDGSKIYVIALEIHHFQSYPPCVCVCMCVFGKGQGGEHPICTDTRRFKFENVDLRVGLEPRVCVFVCVCM